MSCIDPKCNLVPMKGTTKHLNSDSPCRHSSVCSHRRNPANTSLVPPVEIGCIFFSSHVRMQISAWGGDAGMKRIHSRYQWFQCMCQVGIRKCCYGPHEPILPPPHRQNLIAKSPTCPRATACFATWPKHSATHVGVVGRRKGNKKVCLHVQGSSEMQICTLRLFF